MDNSNGKNPLTKIKAVSSDPNAGEVTYAIKSENLKNYFEIDPNEGMLWVSKRGGATSARAVWCNMGK